MSFPQDRRFRIRILSKSGTWIAPPGVTGTVLAQTKENALSRAKKLKSNGKNQAWKFGLYPITDHKVFPVDESTWTIQEA
jgi:hypothetical protein